MLYDDSPHAARGGKPVAEWAYGAPVSAGDRAADLSLAVAEIVVAATSTDNPERRTGANQHRPRAVRTDAIAAVTRRERKPHERLYSGGAQDPHRSEEHTSELQSLRHLVC